MRYTLTALLIVSSFSCFAQMSNADAARSSPELSREDEVRIAEAYNLWKSVGDSIWPGWTNVPMPMLYITPDYEYAIGFPKLLTGFEPQGRRIDQTIQTRKRVLDETLSASFPIDGMQAIVVGTPAALEKSSGEWVLNVTHEMFHVLQYSRGATEKIRSLSLGPESDASWQLNFPFPYKNADVMRLIHMQSYSIYIAMNSADDSELKYNAGTAVEAIRESSALFIAM
jgi:hypothetical protein